MTKTYTIEVEFKAGADEEVREELSGAMEDARDTGIISWFDIQEN